MIGDMAINLQIEGSLYVDVSNRDVRIYIGDKYFHPPDAVKDSVFKMIEEYFQNENNKARLRDLKDVLPDTD